MHLDLFFLYFETCIICVFVIQHICWYFSTFPHNQWNSVSSCSLEVFGVHWVPSSRPDLRAATVWITDDMTPCGPTLTQTIDSEGIYCIAALLDNSCLVVKPHAAACADVLSLIWVNYTLHWVELSLVVLGPVLAVLGYMSDWLSFFENLIPRVCFGKVFYRSILYPWTSLLCLLNHHQVPWVMEPCLNLSPPFIDPCAQFYNQRSIIHSHGVSWG